MLSSISHLESYFDCVRQIKAPLSRVHNIVTQQYDIQWDVLRLDLLDIELSGNKLFKLIPFLHEAKLKNQKTLVSFGGVHSNHLYSLAAAGKRFGFKTIGIVKGYADQPKTKTIVDLQEFGMQLHFANKHEYSQRYDENYLSRLSKEYPDACIIPEGGANHLGEQGAILMAEVIQRSIDEQPYILALSAGTGTSFRGLVKSEGWHEKTRIQVYPALKNADAIQILANDALPELQKRVSWEIIDDYHFGGFAKMNADLAKFIRQFESEQGIPLDPIYTAKLFYAIEVQIQQGKILKGSKIVSLHTGGLQGMRGMKDKIDSLNKITDNSSILEDKYEFV